MKKLHPLLSIFLFVSSICLGKEIIHTEIYDNGNIKSIKYHQLINNKIVLLKIIDFYENGFKKRDHETLEDGRSYFGLNGMIMDKKRRGSCYKWL